MKKISLCLSVLILCIAGSACNRHSKEEVAPLNEEYAGAFPKIEAAKEAAHGKEAVQPTEKPAAGH